MIIIKMNGGLGNQLQQYALYEKLKKLGKDVKVDTSWFYGNQGKQWKQWQTLFWGAPKSLQMMTATMKLKNTCSLEEKL